MAERANVSREYLYRQFKEVIQQLRTTALQQVVTVDGEEVRVRSAGRAATIEVALRNKVKRLKSGFGRGPPAENGAGSPL